MRNFLLPEKLRKTEKQKENSQNKNKKKKKKKKNCFFLKFGSLKECDNLLVNNIYVNMPFP